MVRGVGGGFLRGADAPCLYTGSVSVAFCLGWAVLGCAGDELGYGVACCGMVCCGVA